ncbi:hypothetical protein D3C76_1546070 [compost metagenome]
MLEQSLVYLLKAYRDEGMPVEQAKQRVLEDIAEAEKKYSDAQLLPGRKPTAMSDPIKLIDEIMRDLQGFVPHVSKLGIKAVNNKLIHLKSTLK